MWFLARFPLDCPDCVFQALGSLLYAFYFFRLPPRTMFEGENKRMFATTGITGQVGGEVARNLLSAHQTLRGVVRDVGKGKAWAGLGCQLVSAYCRHPRLPLDPWQQGRLRAAPNRRRYRGFPDGHVLGIRRRNSGLRRRRHQRGEILRFRQKLSARTGAGFNALRNV
jgi:hypothetical protein